MRRRLKLNASKHLQDAHAGLEALKRDLRKGKSGGDRAYRTKALISRIRTMPRLGTERKAILVKMVHELADWVSPAVFLAIAHLAVLPGPKKVALDADGVLWGGDVGLGFADGYPENGRDPDAQGNGPPGFFRWLLQNGHYPDPAKARQTWARHWGKPSFYDKMTECLAGLPEKTVNDWGEKYFAGFHAGEILVPIQKLVAGLKAMGFDVWVVSGGPFAAVAAGARFFDVEADHVIALNLARDHEGTLMPAIEGGMAPWDDGKTAHIDRRILGGRVDQLALAIGDRRGDWPMLDRARFAIMNNPCAASTLQAHKRGWAIQLTPTTNPFAKWTTPAPAPRPMPQLGSPGFHVNPDPAMFSISSQNLRTMPNEKLNSTYPLYLGLDGL